MRSLESYTDKTKLKLDKEVGGGVLRRRWTCDLDLHPSLRTSLHTLLHTISITLFHSLIACGNAYVITYPYARTVNFEMCVEMQLRSHQSPIPKNSQASAWSYKYIGRWMGKTEGSPTGLCENFGRYFRIDFERYFGQYLKRYFDMHVC